MIDEVKVIFGGILDNIVVAIVVDANLYLVVGLGWVGGDNGHWINDPSVCVKRVGCGL